MMLGGRLTPCFMCAGMEGQEYHTSSRREGISASTQQELEPIRCRSLRFRQKPTLC